MSAAAVKPMESALPRPGAGEERGEVAGGLGVDGGEPGCERQLVDAGGRREVREFGEQPGVGEQMHRQQSGGGRAGGGIRVVPEVRGQGVGEPGVDVLLYVRAGSPGEFVPGGFVAFAGFGLFQGAECAQRLELIGPGGDPLGFAQFGFPGGGRGFGGELLLDDAVGVRVVDGVRGRVGEQLVDALPFRELRPAAFVVGQVLVPRVLPRVEPGVLEGLRTTATASMPLARRRTTRRPMRAGSTGSRGAASGASGRRKVRRGVVIFGFAFVVRIRSGPPPERCATARE